jgi:hypothetical protein
MEVQMLLSKVQRTRYDVNRTWQKLRRKNKDRPRKDLGKGCCQTTNARKKDERRTEGYVPNAGSIYRGGEGGRERMAAHTMGGTFQVEEVAVKHAELEWLL